MSAVHFHLAFTHGLVATVVLGILVLAWSLVRRSHDVRMTGLGILLLAGLLAIPVFLTGESAEEVAEHQLNIDHDLIHEHEEAAEFTFIGLEVLGAAALIALLIGMRRKSVAPGIAGTVLALGIAVAATAVRTANLGGEIRHSEIREATDGSGSATPGESGQTEDEEHEH